MKGMLYLKKEQHVHVKNLSKLSCDYHIIVFERSEDRKMAVYYGMISVHVVESRLAGYFCATLKISLSGLNSQTSGLIGQPLKVVG